MDTKINIAEAFDRALQNPDVTSLASLLHKDTVLCQPHIRSIRGKEAAKAEFQRLMNWLPGFHGRVIRTLEKGSLIFIEWEMIFPIGKKAIKIRAVDRILVEDGLVKERAVYFNTLPLIKRILISPGTWLGYIKYRFAKRSPHLLS